MCTVVYVQFVVNNITLWAVGRQFPNQIWSCFISFWLYFFCCFIFFSCYVWGGTVQIESGACCRRHSTNIKTTKKQQQQQKQRKSLAKNQSRHRWRWRLRWGRLSLRPVSSSSGQRCVATLVRIRNSHSHSCDVCRLHAKVKQSNTTHARSPAPRPVPLLSQLSFILSLSHCVRYFEVVNGILY